MTTRTKIILGVAVWLGIALLLGVGLGSSGRNDEFQPTNEFKLDAWIELGPFDITRAVFYLVLAAVLTVGTMLWIANRMQARPNRVQVAVESAYVFMRDNIAGGNMDRAMARQWFPFIAALFLFIWFSNIIGYIPLPTNTHEKIGDVFPSFALYAATANISVPLMLTVMVWVTYHIVGVKQKGAKAYFKSWIPAGITGPAAIPLFVIEIISQFVRLISLSVRLFANILAGHLLILFMGGGLVVILGLAALGVITIVPAVAFFLFEVGLVATLQAFIFATLAAIYLGEAVAEGH